MSTYEDRLAAIEQRIADIELERLYEKRKTPEITPAEQAYDIKQVNHRLTMLLGITSGQEHDIRVIKNDVSSIKDRLTSLESKVDTHTTLLNEHTTRFDRVETLLAQILTRLPEKP